MSTPVTPVGARRRITALAWLGWTPTALATVTGLPERVFRATPDKLQHYCDQDDLNRIGAAYDLLWDTAPPMLSTEDRAAAEVMARHAHLVGWAPPLAYDDDEIDKPNGGPVPGWRRSGAPNPRDAGGLIEDIEFLRDVGYRQATPAELGDRLGRSKEAIGRALARHRQAERQAATAEPAGPCPDDLEASA